MTVIQTKSCACRAFFKTTFTFAAVVLLANGCATEKTSYNKDVSRNSAYWASFDRQKIYQTTVPLFLQAGEDGLGPQLTIEKQTPIDPHRYYTPRGPTSALEYRADPTKWPEIIGLIEAGTRIRPTELREPGTRLGMWRAFYLGAPAYRYVRGLILDGPHAGTTVDMRALGDYVYDFDTNYNPSRGYVLVGPNPAYIAPVD